MIRVFAITLFAALVLLTGLASLPARSQEAPQCAGLPDALATLATRYQELPRVSGLTSSAVLMIITFSFSRDPQFTPRP